MQTTDFYTWLEQDYDPWRDEEHVFSKNPVDPNATQAYMPGQDGQTQKPAVPQSQLSTQKLQQIVKSLKAQIDQLDAQISGVNIVGINNQQQQPTQQQQPQQQPSA